MLFFYCDDNSVIGFAIFILNELLLYTQGVVQRTLCVMLGGASPGPPGLKQALSQHNIPCQSSLLQVAVNLLPVT